VDFNEDRFMSKPTFIWSLYYPEPETRKWRITGLDLDGQQGLHIDIFMYCDKMKHSPNHNMCMVCHERHALPVPTDQRYAYKWYPSKPSLKSVVQWNRRNWERELRTSKENLQVVEKEQL
jgi:hypothetical protein